MSSSVLITIPEEVASAFINHLAKLEPKIANQITIRVLEDSTIERAMKEANVRKVGQTYVPNDDDMRNMTQR